MRALLAGALIVAALAGASAAQTVRETAAASHCTPGETTMYSCRFGRSLGSVCGAPGRIAYRFGPAGKPAIDIPSAPDWGNVRIGRVTGGGGGYQNHLRFSAGGHDYLVHEGAAGNLTERPGMRWSGIVVQQGDAEIANLTCRGKATLVPDSLDRVTGFAPQAVRETLVDDDPRFDAWF